MEPIHLDVIVQSALCHPSDGEVAPLPGCREKGRKESLRESLGEESEWTSKVPVGRLLYAKPCAEWSLWHQGEGAADRDLPFTLYVER